MSSREGLYAYIFASLVAPATSSDAVALLTGVELSWTQAKRRFYQCGSLIPSSVLDGVVSWEGRFRKAYVNNMYHGTLNIGTHVFIGSVVPRGTVASALAPAVIGSLKFTGGNLSNMAAESDAPVIEEQGFILYNVTFLG